jgi:hypothetical protein
MILGGILKSAEVIEYPLLTTSLVVLGGVGLGTCTLAQSSPASVTRNDTS